MKALFVSPWLSRSATGIFEVERSLAHSLSRGRGIEVEALGLYDDHFKSDKKLWEEVPASVYEVCGPRFFGYSPSLDRKLKRTDADIAHLHAIWMYTSIATRKWARHHQKPYIVTINGMLDKWALSNSAWKKKLASFAYERKVMEGAACIQVNTTRELMDVRDFGLKNPVCVIPNGVDLPDRIKSDTECGMPKRLLFLGRMHPKKGLLELIRGYSKWLNDSSFQDKDWQLIIAGSDAHDHLKELLSACEELNLKWSNQPIDCISSDHESHVFFPGTAFGQQKDDLFSLASVFTLPSFSEGQPMAVLDAWSYGKAVLMTPECNLDNGFECGAAIKTHPDADAVCQSISKIAGMTTAELEAVGKAGNDLVRSQYSWHSVSKNIKEVYEYCCGWIEKPDTVDTL